LARGFNSFRPAGTAVPAVRENEGRTFVPMLGGSSVRCRKRGRNRRSAGKFAYFVRDSGGGHL
jgi:hypothetical protein